MSSNKLSGKELGAAQAVIKDFAEHRIPRLNELHELVEKRQKLSDIDIQFLENCLELSKGSVEFAERHPEYSDLVTQVANLYEQITSLALKNEG